MKLANVFYSFNRFIEGVNINDLMYSKIRYSLFVIRNLSFSYLFYYEKCAYCKLKRCG